MTTTRFRLFWMILSLSLFSLGLSLIKGSTSIPLNQLLFNQNETFHIILLKLRLPRTMTAFVSGGLLALAGALMQVLLQNPLADPYILGVSGGAALGALSFMLMGIGVYGLISGAWLGSLVTMLIVLLLAKKHQWQSQALLLMGMALAAGFSAGISFLLLISPSTHLHSLLFWLTGDLTDARFPWIGLGMLIGGLMLSLWLAPGLNILARGDKEAKALGLMTDRYRLTLYLLGSLLTGTAVTLAGCISFIGLIVPHLTRKLSGFDHRFMLPLTVLLGGSLLTLADTCARCLFAPVQLPVGILIALMGVPLFIWLIHHD